MHHRDTARSRASAPSTRRSVRTARARPSAPAGRGQRPPQHGQRVHHHLGARLLEQRAPAGRARAARRPARQRAGSRPRTMASSCTSAPYRPAEECSSRTVRGTRPASRRAGAVQVQPGEPLRGRLGHQARVQQVGQQLDAVHQPRAGAREVGRGVHGRDASAQGGQPLGLLEGLLRGPLGAVAAGHRHHHRRGRGLQLGPSDGARLLAGQAQHVDAAGHLDHLRHPVAAREHRVQPLQRRHRHRLGRGHGVLHVVQPLGGHLHQLLALVGHAGGLGQARHVGQHLADRGGVQRDHRGLGRQPLGHRAHVVVGDGADLAHRLGHDQVGVLLGQRLLVELVQRLALAHVLAHGGVDLGRRQPLGDHAGGQVGQLRGRRRVVALVRYCHDAVAQAELEQHLGRRTEPGKRFAWRERWHV